MFIAIVSFLIRYTVVHETKMSVLTACRSSQVPTYLLPLSLSLLPLLLLLPLSRPRPRTSSSKEPLRLAPVVSTRFLGGDLSVLRRGGESLRLREREREFDPDRDRLEAELEREWDLLLRELEPESDRELELPLEPELELDEIDSERFLFF